LTFQRRTNSNFNIKVKGLYFLKLLEVLKSKHWI